MRFLGERVDVHHSKLRAVADVGDADRRRVWRVHVRRHHGLLGDVHHRVRPPGDLERAPSSYLSGSCQSSTGLVVATDVSSTGRVGCGVGGIIAKETGREGVDHMTAGKSSWPKTAWRVEGALASGCAFSASSRATSREPLPAARLLRVLERDAARPGERRTVAGGRACTRGGSPWACAMDSRRSRREHSLAARGRRARARPARAPAVRTSSGRPASPLLDLRSHRGR